MKCTLIMTLALLISSGFLVASSAQKPDPFADVPLSQRERLKSSLAEFVDYHRAKQWNKVYVCWRSVIRMQP
jgi:hypothetical protein